MRRLRERADRALSAKLPVRLHDELFEPCEAEIVAGAAFATRGLLLVLKGGKQRLFDSCGCCTDRCDVEAPAYSVTLFTSPYTL